MLLSVKAQIAWQAGEHGRPKRQVTTDESNLWIALSEIIPAALCTERLRIAPGGIDLTIDYPFRPFMHHDIKIVIEDYNSVRSRVVLKNQAFIIWEYLNRLIPDKTFDVRIRPGWVAKFSNLNDPVFDCDMSMEAAYTRALGKMKRTT